MSFKFNFGVDIITRDGKYKGRVSGIDLDDADPYKVFALENEPYMIIELENGHCFCTDTDGYNNDNHDYDIMLLSEYEKPVEKQVEFKEGDRIITTDGDQKGKVSGIWVEDEEEYLVIELENGEGYSTDIRGRHKSDHNYSVMLLSEYEKSLVEPVEKPVETNDIKKQRDYASLDNVLKRAYGQASEGKGEERHAQGQAFEDQPMQAICNLLGTSDGLAYQAIKKIQESQRMPETERQVAELLGAINYIAGRIIYIEKEAKK